MTVRLIRMMAKDFAGEFYEQNQRSLRFRRQWPDQDQYAARNWAHFVDMSRAALAALLARPDYPQHLKDAIYADMLEDNERQRDHPHAQDVIQAEFDFVDKQEKNKLSDSDTQVSLPSVAG